MSLNHAILGFISLYPCSGYDSKVDFENGGAGLVSLLSLGMIYPRLKHLENTGLVETHQTKTTGRSKKLYELTGAGWQALVDWLI
ncbi:MAG: PadR family transcriptional regulator [Chloroflexota bacterium]